jgi:hypothetical protein
MSSMPVVPYPKHREKSRTRPNPSPSLFHYLLKLPGQPIELVWDFGVVGLEILSGQFIHPFQHLLAGHELTAMTQVYRIFQAHMLTDCEDMNERRSSGSDGEKGELTA